MTRNQERTFWVEKEFRCELEELISEADTLSELYDRENIHLYFDVIDDSTRWNFRDDVDEDGHNNWKLWCEIVDDYFIANYFDKKSGRVGVPERRDVEEAARGFKGIIDLFRISVETADVNRGTLLTVEEERDYWYEWYFEVDELLRSILYK